MSSPIYSSIQDSGIASTHEIDMDSEFNPNESALDIDEAAENDDNSDKFSSEHLDNNGNESPQDADNANSASTPGSHKSKSSSKHRSSSIGSSGNPKNADDKRRSHSRSFQTLHGGSKIKHLKSLMVSHYGAPISSMTFLHTFSTILKKSFTTVMRARIEDIHLLISTLTLWPDLQNFKDSM